jgi:transcriptional regulator with XRE-family HTH domain
MRLRHTEQRSRGAHRVLHPALVPAQQYAVVLVAQPSNQELGQPLGIAHCLKERHFCLHAVLSEKFYLFYVAFHVPHRTKIRPSRQQTAKRGSGGDGLLLLRVALRQFANQLLETRDKSVGRASLPNLAGSNIRNGWLAARDTVGNRLLRQSSSEKGLHHVLKVRFHASNIGESISECNRNFYVNLYKNSYMDKLDTLGARLRWARQKTQLTQAAAAKAVGLSQPTLSDLENDNTKGTTSLLELAALYSVDVAWLKTGRGHAVSDSGENVKSPNTGIQSTLSMQSAREERARLLTDSLLDVSSEMRGLIDKLVEADREGGAVREMTIAGVGYILQSVPTAQTHKKVK